MFGDWTLFTAFLYVLGIVLLLIEATMPGFGIAGAAGVICVLTSIILITADFYEAFLLLVGTVAVFMLAVIALYKMGYGKKFVKYFVLKTEQKNEEGYTSAYDYKKYIGKKAVALTTLRPAGTIELDNIRLDAVSEGEFIAKDEIVEIIKVDGNRIIVRKINKEA